MSRGSRGRLEDAEVIPVGFRPPLGVVVVTGDGDGDGVTTGNRPFRLFGVTAPGSGNVTGGSVGKSEDEGLGEGAIGMPTRVAIEA